MKNTYFQPSKFGYNIVYSMTKSIAFLMPLIFSALSYADSKPNLLSITGLPISEKEMTTMRDYYQYRYENTKCVLTVQCTNAPDQRKVMICDTEFTRMNIEYQKQNLGYPTCGQVLQGQACFILCSSYGLNFNKIKLTQK